MQTTFWSVNLKGRNQMGDEEKGCKIILKWILKKQVVKECAELNWLSTSHNNSFTSYLFYTFIAGNLYTDFKSIFVVHLMTQPVTVGFQVLTAVVMKIYIFWNITSRIPVKVNPRFGGTCRLHRKGRRVSQARNQCVAGSLLGLPFDPEDESDTFLRNVG
jgi:hypothetical protein